MQKNIGYFQTKDELINWLTLISIDLNQWNTGYAKSVDHLYEEIEKGESSIQLEPPLRIVKVVQVLVTQEDQILIELEQELDDKRKRNRNIPPSEKMKPGEDCLVAAKRCLLEELGVDQNNVILNMQECKANIRYRKSRSYPGLRTKYIIFRVYAQVKGLSQDPFWTVEKTIKDDVEIVRRFCWGWGNLKKIKLPE